jgi:hypothetical protein
MVIELDESELGLIKLALWHYGLVRDVKNQTKALIEKIKSEQAKLG